MGERFGESPYDGCLQEQRDRHIAEMTAQKVLEAQESKGRYYYSVRQTNPQPPPTHKDVLLKAWAQDTEAMARQTVWRHYWISKTCFIFPDGFQTDVLNIAVTHEAAYLNSAAEVGK